MSFEEQMNYSDNNSNDDSYDLNLSYFQDEKKFLHYVIQDYFQDNIGSTSINSNIDILPQDIEKHFPPNTISNNIELKGNDHLNQNEENNQLINIVNNSHEINLLNKKTSRKNVEDKKMNNQNYCGIEIKKNFLLNNKFIIQKYENRGRKSHESKRKTHKKYCDDNVRTKIQVHFMKFLINFTNDILKAGKIKDDDGNDISFLPINYKDKKNISLKYFEELKSCSIKDILQKETSPKYVKYEKYYNKNVYNYISNKISKHESISWIKKYFDIKYLDAYDTFYFEIERVIFQGKEINFSENTKSFNDLLENNQGKMKQNLKTISVRYSIREKIPFKKKFFVTKEK